MTPLLGDAVAATGSVSFRMRKRRHTRNTTNRARTLTIQGSGLREEDEENITFEDKSGANGAIVESPTEETTSMGRASPDKDQISNRRRRQILKRK